MFGMLSVTTSSPRDSMCRRRLLRSAAERALGQRWAGVGHQLEGAVAAVGELLQKLPGRVADRVGIGVDGEFARILAADRHELPPRCRGPALVSDATIRRQSLLGSYPSTSRALVMSRIEAQGLAL